MALTACQPLPHPFAEEPGTVNPLLNLPESYGLAVGEIAGIPAEPAAEVRRRLADALQGEDVLASTRAGNSRAFWLSGTADPAGAGARVDWRLQTPEGDVVRRFEDVDLATSASRGFAREVAEALRSSRPESQLDLAASARHTDGPGLGLAPVEGAPGDGGTALSRALGAALAVRGITVLREDAARLTVQGTVAVKPVRPGVDRVDLVWSVVGPDGQVAGTVKQSNEVAAGSLNGRWGSVAEAAAQGAADGIVGVLDGLHARSVRRG